MAFIILLRFNAVDDKRHCCSAASNPLLYKNFKLCLDFCAAKLPSLHICRRSKTRFTKPPAYLFNKPYPFACIQFRKDFYSLLFAAS